MTLHSDLSAVKQPVAQAKGLPNAHYVDPAAFDEERKSVLFANWSGIG
ncbi:MAG: aromatic ring-hydroxylating dioxygenase subunit alpha, partial [Amylibacter sp.]|nr:aromatic ring-hydroxylating dioxygenase subunit alpha [Amylibacter sp.]